MRGARAGRRRSPSPGGRCGTARRARCVERSARGARRGRGRARPRPRARRRRGSSSRSTTASRSRSSPRTARSTSGRASAAASRRAAWIERDGDPRELDAARDRRRVRRLPRAPHGVAVVGRRRHRGVRRGRRLEPRRRAARRAGRVRAHGVGRRRAAHEIAPLDFAPGLARRRRAALHARGGPRAPREPAGSCASDYEQPFGTLRRRAAGRRRARRGLGRDGAPRGALVAGGRRPRRPRAGRRAHRRRPARPPRARGARRARRRGAAAARRRARAERRVGRGEGARPDARAARRAARARRRLRARRAVRRARGAHRRGRPAARARRLLTLAVAAAAAVTAVLGLDATVVLLTPAVLVAAARARLPARPAAYACTHLANSASLLLPVSNLTNLLAFRAAHVSFARFAALMALPWLVAIAIERGALGRFFRAEVQARAPAADASAPPLCRARRSRCWRRRSSASRSRARWGSTRRGRRPRARSCSRCAPRAPARPRSLARSTCRCSASCSASA